MLGFFRRFQKGIFIAITTVIVISFSFFGTFSAFNNRSPDGEAFKASDGSVVKRSQVDALCAFLSSDVVDQMNWGIPLGVNFLNDGVIRNDFLKSGLGKVLFEEYHNELKEEWEGKWKREKGWQTYRHPEAPYFSADTVWSHFAPELKGAFKNFKSGFETAGEQFEKKAHLYLAEGDFCEGKLRQVLYFQMQQAKWLKPDRSLEQQHLGLFGYRTSSDWFGSEYVRLVSSFILNAAKVAEKKGYKVTSDEALYDLKKQALRAFDVQKQNPQMTSNDPSQYLREQLRYLGMDLSQATEVWQKVLLFRKLFHDLGSAVVVEKATLEPLVDFLGKQVEVVTYQLPQEAQIKDFRQFQRLHTYLKKVGKEFDNGTMPVEWLSANEVEENLLVKHYLVDIKEVDHRHASANISLKALWDWQVSDAGWEKLQKHFAVLGASEATTAEERFAVLDQMDDFMKEMADGKARAFIAEEHPEWIQEALESVPFQRKTLTFFKGGKSPLKGMSSPEKAVEMFDQAEMEVLLRENDKSWLVRLLDKTPWCVATFAECEKEGILDNLTLAYLEADSETQDQVAQETFRRELNRAKRQMADKSESIDLISTYALYDYMNSLRSQEESAIVQPTLATLPDHLPPRVALQDQFKLVKQETTWDRSQNSLGLPFDMLLAVAPNEMSDVVRSNGSLFFYKVVGSQVHEKDAMIHAMVEKSQGALSSAIQTDLAKELLKDVKLKVPHAV